MWSIEKNIWKNTHKITVDNTKFISSEELLSLEDKNIKNIFDNKKIVKWQLSTLKFQVSNDGYRNKIDWNNDTWHTFWFQSELQSNYEGIPYKLNLWLDEYTSWEKFYYNPVTWKRVWNRTNFDNSSRIDTAYVNLTPEVYSENINWINVNWYFWWWINAIWNFWLGDMQKNVHKLFNRYNNKALYEKVSWFSPTINASLELDSIVYWTNNRGISIYGNVDAQLALINKYWSNSISATVGVKAEYDGFWVDISKTEWYNTLPKASKTLINTWLNWHTSSTNLKLYAPLIKDLSVYFEYKKDNNAKYNINNKAYIPNNQTVWWLEYKF